MSLVPTRGHCSKWMQQSDNYEGQPKSPVFSYVKRKPVNIAAPNFYKPSEYTPPLATHISSHLSHIRRAYWYTRQV